MPASTAPTKSGNCAPKQNLNRNSIGGPLLDGRAGLPPELVRHKPDPAISKGALECPLRHQALRAHLTGRGATQAVITPAISKSSVGERARVRRPECC
ncbi:hypothetical protein Ate02nite_95390 [Paractinoplanes tereljensis]|uniref:Uncharacterized protein n=1 Tax=Paractinoplanes tereljensis TaxID=571912 RepID=A0A919TZ41_9ACTN|nr:hypothetical protein Ate02nite_95390 [Actinoplanes tereljensis]